MAFQCPNCGGKKTLRIINSIELAADMRSDEISLQVLHCKNCKFEALGVYEESTRGALISESVDHYGYKCEPEQMRFVKSLIKRCPAPKNARCSCKSHQELNQRDSSGRWIKPGIETGQQIFPIKL